MTRALIVIDVQESFRAHPLWEAVSDPKVADKVDRLVRLARRGGDLVVWVLHAEPGSGDVFDPALGHVRLQAGLERREGEEPLLHKTSHNAFSTTNLQQLLTERGVRELTVCGIRTEQCVETTARLASDLGYLVTFVVDATATHPIPYRDAPADQTVRRTARRPPHPARRRGRPPHGVRPRRPLRHHRDGRRAGGRGGPSGMMTAS